MVDGFLRKVADAVLGGDGDRSEQDYDRRVRPASEDAYGDPADYEDPNNNYAPASQDPFGDPGHGQFGNVRPASEDPYGDPADVGMFGNIRPASEDPYGDPADEENR